MNPLQRLWTIELGALDDQPWRRPWCSRLCGPLAHTATCTNLARRALEPEPDDEPLPAWLRPIVAAASAAAADTSRCACPAQSGAPQRDCEAPDQQVHWSLWRTPTVRALARIREDLAAWREVDSDRPQVGLRVWSTGAEVCCGRRMWRVRWRQR